MICNQENCSDVAVCKYYWPSADKKASFSCERHALLAAKIADVMDFVLPLLEITAMDELQSALEVAKTIEENFGKPTCKTCDGTGDVNGIDPCPDCSR